MIIMALACVCVCGMYVRMLYVCIQQYYHKRNALVPDFWFGDEQTIGDVSRPVYVMVSLFARNT